MQTKFKLYMILTMIKSIYSILLTSVLNFRMGLIAKLFGVQLLPSHLKLLRIYEKLRDEDFVNNGYSEFELLNSRDWLKLSHQVRDYFISFGELNDSKVDWAVNSRVYLDIQNSESTKYRIEQIISSDVFNEKLKKLLGTNSWNIYSYQIWRNYPEDFENTNKEINSSFYHVDNGGPKNNRLLLNVFMYLSPISDKTGPFTFYNKRDSYLINKHFYNYIMKYGNLRKLLVTQKIENFIKPNLLLNSNGAALIINNQECLHRAGFCREGYRDILEIIIEPLI